MIKKLLTFLLTLFLSSFLFAQSTPLPGDHPIAIAAPHLPLILRHDGTGVVFYGERFTYKKEQNETNLRNWIKTYPEEVTKYKVAIAAFLKDTEVSTLTEAQAALYCDLKSQYLMFMQL